MGIRFSCPNGHKLHVKEYLAGKRAVCPSCGAKFIVPPAQESQEPASVRAGAEVGGREHVNPAADAGSASIVISIVEPSRAPLARAKTNSPPAIPQPVSVSPAELGTPMVASPPDAVIPPRVASEPAGLDASIPASPVSKYVAHRKRSRRNQTTLAIALLIAVIVLAVILLVVLRNQGTSAGQGDLGRIEILHTQSYAADAAPQTERQTKSHRTI